MKAFPLYVIPIRQDGIGYCNYSCCCILLGVSRIESEFVTYVQVEVKPKIFLVGMLVINVKLVSCTFPHIIG